MLLLLFVRGRLKDRVRNIEFDNVKTTTLTNKGAALVRFCIDDTSIAFLNCHLAHGTRNYKDRLKNLYTIHQ